MSLWKQNIWKYNPTKNLSDLVEKSLIPTIAEVNLSIKNPNRKVKLRIARIIMQSEMENKHHEKRKLKKDIALISNQLKTGLGVLFRNQTIRQWLAKV